MQRLDRDVDLLALRILGVGITQDFQGGPSDDGAKMSAGDQRHGCRPRLKMLVYHDMRKRLHLRYCRVFGGHAYRHVHAALMMTRSEVSAFSWEVDQGLVTVVPRTIFDR